ncbi:unnamed protein product, partial [marine sediment metagenome]
MEPVWLKLERYGNEFNAYYTTDLESVPWISMSWNPRTVEMSDTVYIGLAVTSHQSGEVRTFTFDNVSTELPKIALRPSPADGSLHEDTLVNLGWNPGDGA